ncbi:MAG TPA: universal stress protein [Polyangiaceae bacterium]|nr:universal stress protein [Polyangiaceae bacterium]
MLPGKILVASDFSDTARVAADWATDFARALGAKLVVVHVFDMPVVGLPDAAFIVDAKTAARLSEQAQRGLDAEMARLRALGAEVEAGLLRQGDARDVIPKAAESEGAGLVVIGSHGRRGLSRALLGSVAESIVRSSSVPVVVVRKPA